MLELLFEGYNVPSVNYGVDSLFSFHQNSPTTTGDGLIISSSTASTHIIPVLDGKGIMSSAKRYVYTQLFSIRFKVEELIFIFFGFAICDRLAWGGSQASDYLLKLMQLKYPTFPGRLSNYQSAVSSLTFLSSSSL